MIKEKIHNLQVYECFNKQDVFLKSLKVSIIFLCLLFFCVGTFAISDNLGLSYNQSEGFTNLNITLIENNSVFIDRIDSVSFVNVTFDDEIFFDNGSLKELTFNFSVEKVPYDFSELIVFNMTNDYNDLVFNYSVLINYDYNFVNTSNSSSNFFMTVINGDYFINTTTDLLPQSKILKYDITGTAGSMISINCGKWLDCPFEVEVDANNRTIFDVEYRIPISASLGKHDSFVNLTMDNISYFSQVVFLVNEPSIEFLTYEFKDECFVHVPGQDYLTVKFECIQEQEEYNVQRLSQFLENFRNNINISCEPEIVTDYVVVGDVDEEVFKNYELCVSEKNDASKKLIGLENKYDICVNDKDALNKIINDNESACLSTTFETAVRLKNEAEKYRHDLKVKYWRNVSVFIILVLLIYLYLAFVKGKKISGWKGKW